MGSHPGAENSEHHIVFYDGYCVLCSKSVDFILSRDQLDKFRFASLQSEFSHKILLEKGYPTTNIQTLSNIVYLRNNVLKIKSDAVLSILWNLGGIYKVMVTKTEVVIDDTELSMEDMSTMDGANTMYDNQLGGMTEDGENDGGYGDPESLIPAQFGVADGNNPLKTVTIGGTEEAPGPAQSVTITLDSKALTGTVQ